MMKKSNNLGIEYLTNNNGMSMSVQNGHVCIDDSDVNDHPDDAMWFSLTREDLIDLFVFYVNNYEEIK